MSRRLSATHISVIAYGSLMSGLGLASLGCLRVRRVARVALHNARRGFAKHSQRGNRFAMVLDPVDCGAPIAARALPPDAPASPEPEGLLLEVPAEALRRIAVREGYDTAALGALEEAAAAEDASLAEFLWQRLSDAAFDAAAYRARLFSLVGYSSPHYIPHPVALDETSRALTFLAPGAEGSGSPRIVPVRVRTGNRPPMTAAEAWRERANETQLAYFATCFLGALHGICQRDLIDDVDREPELTQRLRETLAHHRAAEMRRFLAATGLAEDGYRALLGEPQLLPARSGLSHLLNAIDRGD